MLDPHTSLPAALQDVHEMCKARGFAAGPDPLVNASAQGPATVITVWDDPQPLTLDQIGNMNQPEFAHLYSVQALLHFWNATAQYIVVPANLLLRHSTIA